MGTGNQQAKATGNLGKQLVVNKLSGIGARVVVVAGNANRLTACGRKSTQEISLRVKTCKNGPWHIPVSEGSKARERTGDTDFWVLVDITDIHQPRFYIIPDNWLRNYIYTRHQAFLMAHGGTRPISPDSDHHQVTVDDVAQWNERWDLLHLI